MYYFSESGIFIQYGYMKLLAWVFGSVLFVTGVTAFGAPVYRAGEEISSARSIWHGEVSGGYVFSSHQLENTRRADKTSHLNGFEMRALWAPLSWLAVGAEMDWPETDKLKPAVKEYKVRRTAGIVKLTLAPNTTPRFYMIAGLGKSKHKLTYDRSLLPFHNWLPEEKSFSFWMAGLGLEVDVWKNMFVGAEGTWIHYNKTQLTQIYSLASKKETALRLRIGVRF